MQCPVVKSPLAKIRYTSNMIKLSNNLLKLHQTKSADHVSSKLKEMQKKEYPNAHPEALKYLAEGDGIWDSIGDEYRAKLEDGTIDEAGALLARPNLRHLFGEDLGEDLQEGITAVSPSLSSVLDNMRLNSYNFAAAPQFAKTKREHPRGFWDKVLFRSAKPIANKQEYGDNLARILNESIYQGANRGLSSKSIEFDPKVREILEAGYSPEP